jgi:opacity protein-like surface antigen
MIRVRAIHGYIFFVLFAAAFASGAHAQTDVAASLYGAFSGTTTGNDVQQSPANSAGALIELRHIANPILGFEATYSWNRDDQSYRSASDTNVCAVGCTRVSVPANANEVTADWTPSLHIANLRPFGVLGIGAMFNEPAGGTDTQSQTKAVYVYGAGLDWGILPHIGLRFQYRGNLYKSPDLTRLYGSTNAFTHTAEPMLGAYFRF